MSAVVATAGTPSSLALVAERVRRSGSSFYWAMRLLPERRRQGIFAVYAFCREVDDIADGDAPEIIAGGDRQSGLDRWRREIDCLYAGGMPELPLARALRTPIAEWKLAREDFLAVIDGCAMDAGAPIRRPSLAVLDLYCDRVAGAVGRLCLPIFGDNCPRTIADHLGRALQLTNILRDVAEDAGLGRLYLPEELLAAHGITAADPAQVLADPALPRVCADLAKRAHQHFTAAAAAMDGCSRRAMRPCRLMMAMYGHLLDRLEASGFRGPRVRVPTPLKLWYILRHGLV